MDPPKDQSRFKENHWKWKTVQTGLILGKEGSGAEMVQFPENVPSHLLHSQLHLPPASPGWAPDQAGASAWCPDRFRMKASKTHTA